MKKDNFLKIIKKHFQVDKAVKVKKQVAKLRQKSKELYKKSSIHWSIVKVVFVVSSLVVSYFQYHLYQKVYNDAFQSTAEVFAVPAKNINVSKLFEVLTSERQRSDIFAKTVEVPPVSFDPSRYDVVLRLATESLLVPEENTNDRGDLDNSF